jgi:antitoxin component of MazEF toxin-antitoxin module
MKKKLTRTEAGVALVLDEPLLEELGLDADAEVELSTTDGTLVVTRVPDEAPGERERKFRDAADKINRKYADVFRRLAE